MIFFCKIVFLYDWARVGRFLQIVGFYLELFETFSFEGSWTWLEINYEKLFNRRTGFMSSNLMQISKLQILQFSLWIDTFFLFLFSNCQKNGIIVNLFVFCISAFLPVCQRKKSVMMYISISIITIWLTIPTFSISIYNS